MNSHVAALSCPSCRWDALQRLMSRLLTRLYDRAEQQADSIEDMESLAAVLQQAGGMPPALISALEAALTAEDLDGEYQVCTRLQHEYVIHDGIVGPQHHPAVHNGSRDAGTQGSSAGRAVAAS